MKGVYLFLIAAAALTASTAWAVIGGGEITFHVSGAKDVKYSHEFHVLKKGIKCSECHNAIFKPNASVFSSTMERMRNGETCGVCHNGKRAFDVRGSCEKCHRG